MAKRVHACRLGYKMTPSSRLLATGGASQNTAILQACVTVCVCVCVCLYRAVPLTQIIADIFNMGVYVLEETANSASLGGAYRAKHGI